MDTERTRIIAANPIGKGLDAFRVLFEETCQREFLHPSLDAADKLDAQDFQKLLRVLVRAAQDLSASDLLPSIRPSESLRDDLFRFDIALRRNEVDPDKAKSLFRAAIADTRDDYAFWKQVYVVLTPSTPPPPQVPLQHALVSSLKQTPWRSNTSSVVNSNEYRQDIDRILKMELNYLHAGVDQFHEKMFGRVPGLEAAAAAVFRKCSEGTADPLFMAGSGWRGWPAGAKQDDVLRWLGELCSAVALLSEEHRPETRQYRRRLLAEPNQPVRGSIALRKLDVGFVDDNETELGASSGTHWKHILIPGELKSNPSADTAAQAWFDLGTYAREILASQDTRRFVLGFTLCGSLMRLWLFDRLGGTASHRFNINEDGMLFVKTLLGIFWMSPDDLGFDPTIQKINSKQYIEIQRNGAMERIVLDFQIMRSRCINGRATTCWKAHAQGEEGTPLVVKDSWQYPERVEEGVLLREVTEMGVTNIARYYYHETVQVGGVDDDIRDNVRRGLDLATAKSVSMLSAFESGTGTGTGTSANPKTNGISKKRPSSQGSSTPSAKRPKTNSPAIAQAKHKDADASLNRIHRRVILRDYGLPIYFASSRVALLAALEHCIDGHESLWRAGFLHRDISVNNLMIDEQATDPAHWAFLIDLDHAVCEQRVSASGAKDRTGTRPFMASGILLGREHTFTHDLESFFWVLFWVCIHYDRPGHDIGPTDYDRWNHVSNIALGTEKKGLELSESAFFESTRAFTTYYQPLAPWMNRLRKAIFPLPERIGPDPGLYSTAREILRQARKDPEVLSETT